MEKVTEAINDIPWFSNSSYTHTNGPESIVTAEPTALFLDSSSSATFRLWYKETGSGNTGWKPVCCGGEEATSNRSDLCWIRARGQVYPDPTPLGTTSDISWYSGTEFQGPPYVEGTSSSITWTVDGSSYITFLEGGVYYMSLGVQLTPISGATYQGELNFTLDATNPVIYKGFPAAGASILLNPLANSNQLNGFWSSIISVSTIAVIRPQLNYASDLACSSDTTCTFEFVEVQFCAHRL